MSCNYAHRATVWFIWHHTLEAGAGGGRALLSLLVEQPAKKAAALCGCSCDTRGRGRERCQRDKHVGMF